MGWTQDQKVGDKFICLIIHNTRGLINRGSASNYCFDDDKRFEPVTNTVNKAIQNTVVREPYL